MIHLKHIHIEFEQEIISDGELSIPDGCITVITGESGSGKTSLLYMLGLISSNENCEYNMDGERIDYANRENVHKLQREKIGFLFQDGSLIESLTVGENIKWAAKLAGEKIEESDLSQLLKEVELAENVRDLYPPKLSDSERQRASLATIMAKKAKYILADEPTSALDGKHTSNLVRLLQKMASNGCAVVVATRNHDICEAADKIYQMENKGIHFIKDVSKTGEAAAWKTDKRYKIGGGDLFGYARAVKRKGKGLNALLTVFCTVAIMGFALTDHILNHMSDVRQAILNQLSDREIFVTNQMLSTDSDIKDCDGNLVISDEEFDQIQRIDGVENVYPLFELRSFFINGEEPVTENCITVTTDQTSYPVEYSLENQELPAYFIVLPYFAEQMYEKQLCQTFASGEDVYISYELAEDLHLAQGQADTVELDYQIGVPVKKYIDEVFANGEEATAHIDIAEFAPMHVSVAGILNRNVNNRYTINGDRVIYVPYDMLKDWVAECVKNSSADFAEYSAYELTDWGASACVIYTNSYKNIDAVKGKVETINPHFSTRYDYQGAESIDLMMQNVSNAAKGILIVVMVVVFALMAASFANSTMSRKREYAILKANGMTERDLAKLTIIESVSNGIKIICISLLFGILLSAVFGRILTGAATFISPGAYLVILPVAIAFVMLPAVVSVIYVKRIRADKILKNEKKD